MKRAQQIASIAFLSIAFFATPILAQDYNRSGTVVDIDESRGRLQLETDEASAERVTIETDAVTTMYYGFGTMIAGKPEIFVGSQGMSNVRVGDRVSIRGSVRDTGIVRAERVTLLGREVAASTTGVGQTRPPTSANTPPPRTTAEIAGAATAGRVDGTVRQINEAQGRLVIETAGRRMITVRTYRNTPVYYRNQTYRVSNLEVGDRVRVEADTANAQANEISARRIDVLASVDEAEGDRSGGLVTTLTGRVTRVEPGLNYVYVDDGRSEVRVDMSRAYDAERADVRAGSLRVGERVEISGNYNRVGDLFLASTIRFIDERGEVLTERPTDEYVRYGVVTITGTLTETLEEGPTLGFRDRDTNRVLRIWVTPSFVVRTKGNTYISAEALRLNDTAVIDAFRDAAGNLIAQGIRLRNR